MVGTAPAELESGSNPFRFDRAEMAGALGDLGVLVPIAVALIVKNGLTPTAVLLPAGVLYVVAGLIYRLPVPVQPLKAFGAIAIAHGFGADDIAAGALLMGLLFLALGASGLLDWVAKVFPHAIIRGIQLSVGLLFCQLAWRLVSATPKSFVDHRHSPLYVVGLTVLVVVVALLLRHRQITLVYIVIAVVAMVLAFHGAVTFGPSAIHVPHLSRHAFAAAAVALVLPQVPLSFANSCLATADTARTYFGDAAARVRPGRLATTIGIANLFAGSISGMPVCHGAGGMTAHRTFGARSGGAPIMLGGLLIALALGIGAALTTALTGFPVPILAGLLTVAGLLHITLLRDLKGPWQWALAIGVGVTGFLSNLAVALVGALLLWWAVHLVRSRRTRQE
ncbi:putative sulfate/molybdate transporter [Candidatus Mycobacterium wuenschmannii]|uniref:Sulfate/molybdate transporter n=1 Tax=Candidatus Mycobacterium wuenschmannii TaxID=3027808 RepID=A0ABY8VYN8_9MYCO|nr:putative sulfate/molybdate transporter [Candidatus Mycobacterium wuenschmannii]WIM88744.1 putative sulfate/molybdate transporter [Candidatus Mycobacterium wuenschmannii]